VLPACSLEGAVVVERIRAGDAGGQTVSAGSPSGRTSEDNEALVRAPTRPLPAKAAGRDRALPRR
jgi:hypothetical protein